MNLIVEEQWARELERPRQRDERRLTAHGHKVYCQNDEDGILAEIFKRVGIRDRTFVEFGVETGIECNSIWLLLQGWSGLWIEGSAGFCETMRTTHHHWIASGALTLTNAFITAENINDLIRPRFNEVEIDLLSVDIDFNDFWVWREINVVRPRVVVIEYNATWRPPASLVVPYDAERVWTGGNYFGASLNAMAALGEAKGYALVGCSLSGANAFFVRRDLIGDRFLNPGSVEDHYEPARYWVSHISSGHEAAVGPLLRVEGASG